MRPVFARGRASARHHIKHVPITLLSLAVAAALSACGDSATAPASASSGTLAMESVAFTVAGVTYPTVTVQGLSGNLAVGGHATLTAALATPTAKWLGAQVTWKSSNTGVVSIQTQNWGSAKGDNAVLTGVANGTAIITGTTQSGTSGSITVTVGSAGTAPVSSGGFHEPSGMHTQINTGAMTTAPATSYPADTWTEGGTTFTNYSPTSMSSTGEWSKNLSAVPGGGVRVTYNPSLAGGNSPVRFGATIPSTGSGYLYVRWKFRLSSNWTLSNASGLKVMEPRTVNSSENHVLGVGADGQSTNGSNMWIGALLQFATSSGTSGINVPGNSSGQSPVPSQVFSSTVANVGGAARGSWHTMEASFQPESSAGTKNAVITFWVDGVQVNQSGGLHLFLSGERMGWNFLMFDPTYGGDASSDHPPASIYWDIDQLYVSTK